MLSCCDFEEAELQSESKINLDQIPETDCKIETVTQCTKTRFLEFQSGRFKVFKTLILEVIVQNAHLFKGLELLQTLGFARINIVIILSSAIFL